MRLHDLLRSTYEIDIIGSENVLKMLTSAYLIVTVGSGNYYSLVMTNNDLYLFDLIDRTKILTFSDQIGEILMKKSGQETLNQRACMKNVMKVNVPIKFTQDRSK
jgi:uncharacterized protein with ATP-grasp and redox domains